MDVQRPVMKGSKPFQIDKWEVWRAWERVLANKGAPGEDGESLEDFAKDLEGNLYKVWNRMSSGTYFPPPVKAVEIPKASGGTRLLGVPAVADRVAQTVAAARVEAAVEPLFRPDSYGYRPRKSALDAVGACRERCWRYDWVVEFDIRKFFDAVPWDLMVKAVEAHVEEKWVILYVKRWLAAPLRMPDGTLAERDRGTPQGSCVSPVLANLFMHHAFDMWMEREFPACPYERYADDGVVHCSSEAEARDVRAALAARMGEVGLELHPDKTRIVYCRDSNRRAPWDGPESFDFLGYAFRARAVQGKRGRFTGFGPAVSGTAVKAMSQTVRSWRLHRHVNLTWEQLVQWIGPLIRGWMSYYGRYYRSALYPLLARVNFYIQRWLRRKYRRLRPLKALARAWKRITAQNPRALPHWQWTTGVTW
jgi:group II intron reverse transcriptase/maturase